MRLIYYSRWLDWEKLQLRPQFRRLEEEQGNGKRNEGRGRERGREGGTRWRSLRPAVGNDEQNRWRAVCSRRMKRLEAEQCEYGTHDVDCVNNIILAMIWLDATMTTTTMMIMAI